MQQNASDSAHWMIKKKNYSAPTPPPHLKKEIIEKGCQMQINGDF